MRGKVNKMECKCIECGKIFNSELGRKWCDILCKRETLKNDFKNCSIETIKDFIEYHKEEIKGYEFLIEHNKKLLKLHEERLERKQSNNKENENRI